MERSRGRLGLRIKQSFASLMLAISMALGISVATTAPAQASTTYVYPVYGVYVCNWQGHFGASSWNPWNPYSMYCYDLSIPAGFTITSGLDINGYCQAKYRGTHAELWGSTIFDWKCVRRTA